MSQRVIFGKGETHEGETEWFFDDADGAIGGTMTRSTPTRWHGNGCSGMVSDHEALKTWDVCIFAGVPEEVRLDVADGSTVKQAKDAVRAWFRIVGR